MVMVLVGIAWLVASEGGLRLTCRLLVDLVGDQLKLDEPAGTLLGPFSLHSARWRSATLDVQARELEVDWRPSELLSRRLMLQRLTLATLRVASRADGDPPALPENLRLPLSLLIDQLSVGRIELGDYAFPDGRAAVVAEAITAGIASDDEAHRVFAGRARVAGVAVEAEASVSIAPPFAFKLDSILGGDLGERPVALVLSGGGTLAAVTLDGRLRVSGETVGQPPAGHVVAQITPFARQPLRSLVAGVTGLDPAAWVNGAPQAQLDLALSLQPQEPTEAGLGGRLTVVNRRPGAVDRGLLPIVSLSAELAGEGGPLRAEALDVRLAGGGRLTGRAALDEGDLALSVMASAVDARALHSALRRTQLAGSVHATLSLLRQRLHLDLHDAQLAVQGRLQIDPETVSLEQLRFAAGRAQLRADGSVSLAGSGVFALQGSLRDFDPSRFARLPSAQLNADFVLRGSRRPQLALALRFQLHDSRLEKEPLTGGGEIDVAGERLRKAEVALAAAGNRLSATGAFGAAGDRLQVTIEAPTLDRLGIAGNFSGQLQLGGSVKLPELQVRFHSAQLALPGYGEIRGGDLDARLAPGDEGELVGKLRLGAVSTAAGTTVLRDLTLEVDGVRRAHRLQGRAELPAKRGLRWLLAGGLSSAAAGWTWAGTLNELTLSTAGDAETRFLQLSAPMPLQVASASLSAGPAAFAGDGWSLQLQSLRYGQQRWQTAGGFRGLAVAAVLVEFPELFGSSVSMAKGSDEALRVAGEWDIDTAGTGDRFARLPAGRVHLWRESGDLVVGTLPLGLQAADLRWQLGGGRVSAQAQLRGRRLGEISAEWTAGSRGDGFIDRQSRWRGVLRLNAPDLAWLGPLLGDGWQTGGRLVGDLLVDGTPAQPQISGEWRGEQLAVRALDQGMRLERGRLVLQVAGGGGGDLRLVLQQLLFDSELQPMPRSLLLDARLDGAALTRSPGRLEVSGELRTGQADGFLTVRADRVGLLQRPEQWLLASGEARLSIKQRSLDVLGNVRADAGYWQLAKSSTPQLSDDVVVHRRGGERKASLPARLLTVNLEVDLGRNFHFSGAGVDSRLAGTVKLHADGAGLPRATGTIRTREGRFDAYGQHLEIERGILNFQGLLDNPGLNIVAVRRNLPVEAGVEVTGTARRPLIRLVSDPEVPDAEKLSWLVLGRGPEQQGGKDTGVLMAAAQTILGGQDGGPLKAIQRSLGIDEFGVRSGTLDGSGRWQSSRVASTSGFGSSDTTTDQIVSVGKRLAANVVLSYDQSLSAAGSVVKLTVDLTRNLSLVGRAGTDTGFDLLWNDRFGR